MKNSSTQICVAGQSAQRRSHHLRLLTASIYALAALCVRAQAPPAETNALWIVPAPPPQNASPLQISPADLAALTNALGPVPLDAGLNSLNAAPSMANGPSGPLVAIQSTGRLINVNLGGTWSNPPKVGFAAIGQNTNDFWNSCVFQGSTNYSFSPLKWSDGTDSSAGISVYDAPGLWGNGSPDAMFNSYIYPWDSSDISVVLSGLPTNRYDLYVYGHAAAANANGVFELMRNGVRLGYKGTTIWSDPCPSTDWEEGQHFVVFRNIQVDNQPITIFVDHGADTYAYINGLQIVATSAVPTNLPQIYNLLNINFGNITAKSGFAAIGQTTNDFWNWHNFPGITNTSMTNLRWANNVQSSVGLNVQNGPGYWVNSTGDPMYDTYIYPWTYGGHITASLTNLPPDSYDVYVYGHASADNANSVYQLAVGGASYGPKGTSIWGSGWNSSTLWEEGQQYIVFRNVPVAAGQTVTLDVQPNANGYAYLNGLQVAVPLDRDGNGLPDWWEKLYFGHTGVDPREDPDHDGLTNAEEYHIGTDPTNADTGNTGVPDGAKDSDGDGLSNLAELRKYHSDPANAHTFNSVRNDAEYLFTAGLDDPTTMADLTIQDLGSGRLRVSITGGFPNDNYDLYYTSDLTVRRWQWRALHCGIQTDGKGQATFDFTQPDPTVGFFIVLEASDDDGDGLSNGYESWVTYQNGTQKTSVSNADTDVDCMNDGWEVEYGLDPTDPNGANGNANCPCDPDGDNLANVVEHNDYYSQPLTTCFHPQGVTTWNAEYDPLKNHDNQASRTVVTISCSYENNPPLDGTQQRTAHFIITRATYHPSGVPDPMADPLTVYYSLGGNLRYSIDYTLSPVPPASPPSADGTPRIFIATIGAGFPSTTIDVTVLASVVPAGQVGTIVAAITPWPVAANPPPANPPLPATWQYVVDWRNNRTRLSFAAGVTRNVPSLAPSHFPYSTIQAAYDACNAGDTVLVEDGAHNEGLHLYKNASSGSPITVRAVTIGQAAIYPVNVATYGNIAVYIRGDW